jgi:probable F420-dependent oxidoreductase
MKFALFGINVGPCAHPESAARVARAAEQSGLESVWTGEHVVLPDPQIPPSPSAPETPFLDPAVALAYIAAQTSTIRLGTGIIILPQRNPLVLAKELASVDVVSNGRLIFGLGVGYLQPEFAALGIPFEDKGARAVDYLQAMLALWTLPNPAHHGRFTSFAGVQAFPRPIQRPHPPIVIGGHRPSALRRAVRYANGWYGFALDLEGTERCIATLRAAERTHGRPFELGTLEISVTPRAAIELDTARRFADAGVDRLIFYRPVTTEAEMLGLVEKIAALRSAFEARTGRD